MPVKRSPDQEAALLAWGEANPDTPIVMLNLLRFAEQAHPGYGCDGMTGREAYRAYGAGLMAMDPPFPGTPIWLGTAGVDVIAPEGEHWDEVILVRYDSVSAFTEATSRPDYLEIAEKRTAALDDSRLILAIEGFGTGT